MEKEFSAAAFCHNFWTKLDQCESELRVLFVLPLLYVLRRPQAVCRDLSWDLRTYVYSNCMRVFGVRGLDKRKAKCV